MMRTPPPPKRSHPCGVDDASDDDDEQLLKPQFRTKTTVASSSSSSVGASPSGASIRSTGSSTTITTTTNASSTLKVPPSSEELEAKALKDAKFYVDFKLDYKAIVSASMLKWYRIKRKGKHATKSARTRTASAATTATHTFVPCFVCPDEVRAGWEDSVKVTPKHNTLVQFLGQCYTHSNKVQAVDASHLVDHNDATDETNEQEQNLPVVGTTAAIATVASSSSKTQWSSAKLEAHLKSVHSQTYKKDENRALKVRTEKWILVLILQAAHTASLQQTEASGISESPEMEESEHEHMELDEPIHPSSSTSPPRLQPVEPRLCLEETEDKKGLNVRESRPVSTAKPRVRAGDIIAYYPPHVVTHGYNIEQATVVNCYPGKGRNGFSLHLANGTFLPRGHQVRILQRYVKGVYQDVTSTSRFVPLRKCVIESKNNGKILVTTLADHVGSMYAQLRETADLCRTVDNPEATATTTIAGPGEISTTTSAGPCETVTLSPVHCPLAARPAVVQASTKAIPNVPTVAPDKRVPKKRNAAPDTTRQPSKALVRKATTTSDAPETSNNNNEWKPHLQRMLDDCTESRKRRRADYGHIETCETALKTAMAVRQRLDQVAANQPSDEHHWGQWQDSMECSRERLQDFLTGNRQNLISAESVRDMSAKFKAWLDDTLSL